MKDPLAISVWSGAGLPLQVGLLCTSTKDKGLSGLRRSQEGVNKAFGLARCSWPCTSPDTGEEKLTNGSLIDLNRIEREHALPADFLDQNNNMNEVNRDSRMNVHRDNDWKAFYMSFSLNTCMYSFLLLYFSQVFVVTVWSVELYMLPLALLVLFAYNFSLIKTGKVNNTQDAQASKVAGTFLAAPAWICPWAKCHAF